MNVQLTQYLGCGFSFQNYVAECLLYTEYVETGKDQRQKINSV